MSLMTNDSIVLFPHDTIVAKLFWFIPRAVEPNHLTILRIVLVPVIATLLFFQSYLWAAIVFGIAALTDLLDGSLARTRSQITLWGTIADPAADKLLISVVLGYFVLTGLPWWIGSLVIGFEVAIIGVAIRRQRRGLYASANTYGKIKMLLQVLGVTAVFLSMLFSLSWMYPLAMGCFLVSVVFAFLSLITYGL